MPSRKGLRGHPPEMPGAPDGVPYGTAATTSDGQIRIPMRGALDPGPGKLERVLTHELTHVIIRAIAPRAVPTWLNEGPARRPCAQLRRAIGQPGATAFAESAGAARRLFDRVGGAGVVALLQDMARSVPLTEAFERRLLTPYSTLVGSLDPAR